MHTAGSHPLTTRAGSARRFWAPAAVVLALALLAAGCAAQKPAVARPETLLDTRCAECHELSRVASAKHDRAEWAKTIDRMIGHGARLNDDEKQVLIEYLAGRDE